MSDSKITMIGMYDIMKYDGVDLFELLSLPDGIDKDTVVADILQTSSEFEVMYSSPQFIHDSIRYWSKKWFWTFDKWIKAINIEYSPLDNYDRHEEWTDDNTHSDDDSLSSKRTETGNVSGSSSGDTTSQNNGTSDVETLKSAFDSGSYSPYEDVKSASADNSAIHNQDQTTSSSNTVDDYGETKKNAGQFQNVHKGYMHGNIGVTSSQDMLQQELDVAMFNLYDRITDIFIQEYCIPVYI